MRFTVLTLFPKQVQDILGHSIISRATARGLIEISSVDIRDFSTNKHRKVDDTLYGGGTGMLMQAQPVYDAWKSTVIDGKKPHTVYLSPQGKVFNQQKAIELSKREHIVFLCGHYEGVDQRAIDLIVDEEISIGDYVLTGGELASCVIIDAIARLIPDVLPDSSAFENESHMNGLLEAPHYTKPEEFMGLGVPDVLREGHHLKIEQWRHGEALLNTFKKRPDMLDVLSLTVDEWMLLIDRLDYQA
ncbi:MAG: tRNA (guanosine(37)-N1)-methyltransferase TrmD [Clostridiaceae bacterium]|nr:tRNA (guanosine(37)-N1)-methyltransferase TrmD [Clostridiaceae bacterium]